MGALTKEQVSNFIDFGFIAIPGAFSTALADECRAILWKATQCDPHNRATWTRPVIRIGELAHEPFRKTANTSVLHSAFDELVGKGNWMPRNSLGSFPIRFPSDAPAGDTGWHVDASFPGADKDDFKKWRINFQSKGRGLLMLFLFSDIGEHDAPTVIKVGSHLDVAKILWPIGEEGMSFLELAQKLKDLPPRDQALAIGDAGTVYLCHPFIVHAAQDHRGKNPKFMASHLSRRNRISISDVMKSNCRL